jgi:hypothetical protein
LATSRQNGVLPENAKNDRLTKFVELNLECNGVENMIAEDILIDKLKTEISKTLPPMVAGMAENMLDKNKEVIINWLKDNKGLVKEVIDK